ncbi:prostaglandin D2 synthase, hematopoietic a [Xenopus laevis]|uniref:glutathione transferase n=3 Tax=Xenopus laevis TaxID=8355 RepID=Q6PA42_XENLA|nr:prostaglandin D2 synthase, hematopoietic a [Xenopus laevis]AAH60462.1 MGC68589 protein [Xenopus laevis]
MPSYKLIYFNLEGRGEILRYLFSYSNIEFEDRRLEFADWPALKPSIPYGQLPVVEIDGVIFNQSLAIGRYLAKKAGLIGKNDLDEIRVDAIIDTIDDFFSKFPWMDTDKAKKEFMDKSGIQLLAYLEKTLGNNSWFVGDSVTWADFYWDTCADCFENYLPGFAKDYPKLLALQERVKAIPAIASWIKKRPKKTQ